VEAVTGTIADVEGSTGIIKNEAPTTVAYLRNPDITYHNSIHEQLTHSDGSLLRVFHIKDMRVFHSGYSSEILNKKAARNLSMLALMAKKEEDELGGAHLPLTDFYILRENLAERNYEAAFKGFMALHNNPESVRALMPYIAIATTYFYLGLEVAASLRDRVSRIDIYRNLVLLMKKLYPAFAGSEFIDLIYQINFDMKDDVFLEGFCKIMPSFDPRADNSNSDAIRAFAVASSRAAAIFWRRRNLEKAFECCVARFKCSDIFDSSVFSILLSCIKGQPESDTIVFLNALFDSSSPVKAHMLTEGLLHEGFQVIFKYYVMKQVELGTAAKKHFLELLILNGNFDEAASRARSLAGSSDPDMISEVVSLAVICSGRADLHEEYKDLLNLKCSELADCFLGGGQVLSVQLFNPAMASSLYTRVHFLAGHARARQFLRMFGAQPQFCFLIESKFNIENSMGVRVLLSEYMNAADGNPATAELVLAALLQTSRHREALSRIKGELDSGEANSALLNNLLTLAQAAAPHIADEARRLYENHARLFDEYVDMDDVAKTGIAFDNTKKRGKKRLAELNESEFMKEVDSDPHVTDNPRYLEAMEGAAAVYEKEGMPAMAIHCHMRLYACGHKTKQTLENLARLFKKAGNKRLAPKLKAVSDAMGAPPPPEAADTLVRPKPPSQTGRGRLN
jgi:hypothetical protein